MSVLYEWNFHNRVCRVVESEPGIVHFEEASRTTGDPSVMLFNWTVAPFGAANEIIQLSMALAEANVINRDLSASIAKFQEERNRSDKEIAELERKSGELRSATATLLGTDEYDSDWGEYCSRAQRALDAFLPIPLPEGTGKP